MPRPAPPPFRPIGFDPSSRRSGRLLGEGNSRPRRSGKGSLEKESRKGIPVGHCRRSRLRIDYRSTFTYSLLVNGTALASGGILSVVEQKVRKESTKGYGLWNLGSTQRINQRLRPLESRGARVGRGLSLARSQGSLLLARSQPSRLRRERPTAVALMYRPLEGAVIDVNDSLSH
jgi:hypothetical protein